MGAFFYSCCCKMIRLLLYVRLWVAAYFYMMNSDTGKWIIIAGVMIVVAGVIIYFFHDKLNWIGRLPGDIRIEKDNFKFYFPITTMIIFSLFFTLIIQLIKKFLN